MEENKEKETTYVEAEPIVENATNNQEQNSSIDEQPKEKVKNILIKILNVFKNNFKKVILGLIIIILIIVIIDIIYLSPKEVVQKFIGSINNCDSEKALSYIDWIGYYTYSYSSDEDDFWDNYLENKNDEDYQEILENVEENADDEYYEDLDYELDDENVTYKIQEVRSVEKIADHLYTVKVKIKAIDEDGDSDTDTVTFVVMTNGLKSYIIDMGDFEYIF